MNSNFDDDCFDFFQKQIGVAKDRKELFEFMSFVSTHLGAMLGMMHELDKRDINEICQQCENVMFNAAVKVRKRTDEI